MNKVVASVLRHKSTHEVFRVSLLILGVLCGVVGGAQPRPVWEEYLASLESRIQPQKWMEGVGLVSSCDEAKRLAQRLA